MSGGTFSRATFLGATFLDVKADSATFEHADLRQVKLFGSDFSMANFVGADLSDGQAGECDFYGTDFYWADVDAFDTRECDMNHARMPEGSTPRHGPDVRAPEMSPTPLYRTAIDADERQRRVDDALSSISSPS
jgi:hypothetical protein